MELNNKKHNNDLLKKTIFSDGSMIIEYEWYTILVDAQAEYWTSPILKMKYSIISKN